MPRAPRRSYRRGMSRLGRPLIGSDSPAREFACGSRGRCGDGGTFQAATGPLADRLVAAPPPATRLAVIAAGVRPRPSSPGRPGYLGRNDALVVSAGRRSPGFRCRVVASAAAERTLFRVQPSRRPVGAGRRTARRDEAPACGRPGISRRPRRGVERHVEAAFDRFCGTENLEERIDLVQRTIDRPALDYIRRASGPGGGATTG